MAPGKQNVRGLLAQKTKKVINFFFKPCSCVKFNLIIVKVFELFFIVFLRSTEEIFALFISLAFTVDAISSVIKGNFKEINCLSEILSKTYTYINFKLWII